MAGILKNSVMHLRGNYNRTKKIILIMCFAGLAATSQSQNTINIDSIIHASTNSFKMGKCEEALPLLKGALQECTSASDIHRITGLMMDCYLANGQIDEFFDVIAYGHQHKVVYRFPKFFADSLKKNLKCDKALITNDSLLSIQRKTAKPAYQIVLPDNYNEGIEYPLFIVLTKGWRTKQVLINSYRSPRVKGEFIVAFIHSSDFIGTNFYEWPKDEFETMPEIENLYAEIISRYPIDTTKIVISGMSNAGRMAINTVFRSHIPITEFVTFCAVNAHVTDEEIKIANQKNMKGILIAGKKDKRFFSDSEAMYKKLKSNDFSVRFESGDFGHQIPVDSYLYIDEAVKFMTE